MRKRASSGVPEHEAALFRDAVRGATPLASTPRVQPKAKAPPPVPVQSLLDGHDALVESLAGPISWDQSIETGNEPSYLRSGLARDVLRKLRRGHWVVQDVVDLHGCGPWKGSALARTRAGAEGKSTAVVDAAKRSPRLLRGPEKSRWGRCAAGAVESLGLRQVEQAFSQDPSTR